jgi:hypothetical protein
LFFLHRSALPGKQIQIRLKENTMNARKELMSGLMSVVKPALFSAAPGNGGPSERQESRSGDRAVTARVD